MQLLPRTVSRVLVSQSHHHHYQHHSAMNYARSTFSSNNGRAQPSDNGPSTRTMTTQRVVMAVPEWIVQTVVHRPLASIGSVAGVVTLWAMWQYRGSIRRRLRYLREESWLFGAGVTMERVPTDELRRRKTNIKEEGLFAHLALLELNPTFARQAADEGWSLMTLGDYLSSLRPKQLPKNYSPDAIPNIVQREIEAGLGLAMLRVLGPNLGVALLPAVVGSHLIQKRAQFLAASAARKWFLDEDDEDNDKSDNQPESIASRDKGAMPLGFLTLLAGANLNAKLNRGDKHDEEDDAVQDAIPNSNLTTMEKMAVGEIVKGQPSFVDPSDNMVPEHNFCIATDFEDVIQRMEAKLGAHPDHQEGHVTSAEHELALEVTDPKANEEKKEQTTTYDPEDTSMAAPVPINSRLFPDLHMGWGDAKCTQTKREVLRMRLIALLLNRLGANYQKIDKEDDMYTVQMAADGPKMTKPSELVQALVDAGHEIQVVPTSRLTTFGLALCVKEPDNRWTNIPLGVFLESGFEDEHGNSCPAMMPHSGLDMHLTGPLAGKRADGTPSTLRVQHYIGIEGFCGWKSHELPQVPFSQAVEHGPRLTEPAEVVRATRLAALHAIALNGVATDLHLPFGGYGVTSVCNDSAAVIQQCLYDRSTIYPLTSIGKFAQRTMRYAQRLQKRLDAVGTYDDEVRELTALVHAMKQLPNDINSAPSNAESAARRMLRTLQPRLPFLLNADSKLVMESVLAEASDERNVHRIKAQERRLAKQQH